MKKVILFFFSQFILLSVLTAGDCFRPRHSELFDISTVVLFGKITGKQKGKDGKEIVYEIAIKKNFKQTQITSLKLRGMELSLGTEFIVFAEQEGVFTYPDQNSYIPNCWKRIIIKSDDFTKYDYRDLMVSKKRFKFILHTLKERAKRIPSENPYIYLRSNAFDHSTKMMSLENVQVLKKDQKLIFIQVVVGKDGRAKSYKIKAKAFLRRKKIQSAISEKVDQCVWTIKENRSGAYVSLIPVIYAKKENLLIRDFR